MKRALLPAFSLYILLVLALSCGDDVADPGDTPPVPETFSSFLVNFARAYATRDSTAYAAHLDSSYTFELLDDEPDPDFPQGYWDRAEELHIAGNMFHGRANGTGKSVRDIDLGFTLLSSVEDQNSYPEKPVGETWYRVTAYVDLLVVVNDPDEPSGIMHFLVGSNQVFVIRRDPTGSGRYLVYRQIDQQSINKSGSGSGAGTKETNWGAVKSFFR